MRTYLLLAFSFCFPHLALLAQNTFPSSGNVGIGTTSPAATLSFTDVNNTTSTTGITWYSAEGATNSTYYGIHRTSGSWSAPDYQQLRLGWQTGIVLDPGTLYGKSYVDIKGNGLRITNGSVGIGLTSPRSKLEVTGDGRFSSSNSGSSLIIETSSLATGNNYSNVRLASGSASGSGWLTTKIDNWGGYFNWTRGSASGDVELMRIDATNGTVGIGTWNIGNSSYKLYVESGIRTRKVKVDQNGWPDYVFSSIYKLPSLKEVEQFIKQHNHLPEVPSAIEVEKDGLDLGENQTVLLKKIEELTLYIINQQREIEKLKEENCGIDDLRKEIVSIKQLLSNIKH